MSLTRTALLGLIAGGTILIGLPIGRMRSPAPALRAMLNATAVGILMFLVWDVLSAAWEPIDSAVAGLHDGHGQLGSAIGYGALFAGGLAVGLLGLVGYENWLSRAARRPVPAREQRVGPGAMAASEVVQRRGGIATWAPAYRLALLIAVGIGLHNFAEGLAIGQSAASGELALATLLVIGFALHNATEGFGIIAPVTAEREGTARPRWRFLIMLGVIGGGPTFAGTLVGHSFSSEPTAVLFLTLAAGSILYVVMQLLFVAARSARRDLVAYGLLLGLLAGFLTDAIVSAAGA